MDEHKQRGHTLRQGTERDRLIAVTTQSTGEEGAQVTSEQSRDRIEDKRERKGKRGGGCTGRRREAHKPSVMASTEKPLEQIKEEDGVDR